jgi:hypothetical protein
LIVITPFAVDIEVVAGAGGSDDVVELGVVELGGVDDETVGATRG